MARWPVVVCLLCLNSAACSGGEDSSVCEPEAVQACICRDGSSGSQICAADGGSWADCVCECEGLPKSQSLSQPCCLAHGLDACGAHLFCSAFDGRTQSTCYSERSQLDRRECFEDRHCASGSCNPTAKRCRSMPGTACESAIGCADDAAAQRYYCEESASTPTCKAVGNGFGGANCGETKDCLGGVCVENRCRAGLTERCLDSAGCLEGECVWCRSLGSPSRAICGKGEDEVKQCLRQCEYWGGSTYHQESCWDGAACSSNEECESDLCSSPSGTSTKTCFGRSGDGCDPYEGGYCDGPGGYCRHCRTGNCARPDLHLAECD